jgi:hypothetical protein
MFFFVCAEGEEVRCLIAKTRVRTDDFSDIVSGLTGPYVVVEI